MQLKIDAAVTEGETELGGEVKMKLLEEKILKEGKVLPGNILKVDGFLNHRIDVKFICEIGKEFKRLFGDCGINKILTIEASGIGIACITAQFFDVPVVFAKKNKSKNISDSVYTSEVASFTHGNVNTVMVSKDFLSKDDVILVIDDFLANGNALNGLIDIIETAGAKVAGCGIVIEKAYQEGGKRLRDRGYRVESLAKIQSMSDDSVVFCD